MYTIVAIYGRSGSGKDTVLRYFKNLSYELWQSDIVNIITFFTTRPKRDYERNGDDYYFISDEDMIEMIKNNDMLDVAFFGPKEQWTYGLGKKSLIDRETGINFGVFSSESIVNLIDSYPYINVIPVEVDASPKDCLIRCLTREKEPDIDEIYRRYKSDNDNWFLPAGLEPDYIINNSADIGFSTLKDKCLSIFEDILDKYKNGKI